MDIIYKRKDRSVSSETRQKISQALKGRKKSVEHCKHISDGLSSKTGGYWSHIPKAEEKDDDVL